MRLAVLCDGSPATRMEPPATAPETAIQTIAALSKKWDDKRLFGFLEPSMSASYYEPYHQLSILCAPCLTKRGTNYAVTEWCWTKIWEHEDWWEAGWHPCNAASCSIIPALLEQVKHALNPDRYRI